MHMSEEMKKTVEETLDDLFSDSKAAIDQIVELPSRGIGYPEGMNKVTIRNMTFEDEKILSESTPDQDVVNLLLTRCVDNLDPDILYAPDKIYLLYKIRELSYGATVKLTGVSQSRSAAPGILNFIFLPRSGKSTTFVSVKSSEAITTGS